MKQMNDVKYYLCHIISKHLILLIIDLQFFFQFGGVEIPGQTKQNKKKLNLLWKKNRKWWIGWADKPLGDAIYRNWLVETLERVEIGIEIPKYQAIWNKIKRNNT